jgi:hypothetical protein
MPVIASCISVLGFLHSLIPQVFRETFRIVHAARGEPALVHRYHDVGWHASGFLRWIPA